MNDDLTQPNNAQSLQCNVCQKVNMADGTQVWVCKDCGTQHQPGEAQVADAATAAQATVDQAAAVTSPAAGGDQPIQ